jgi:hypothetical protein
VSKKKPSLIPQHGGGSKNDSFFKNMIQKYYSIKTDAAIDAITFQSVHHGVSTGSVQTKEKHYISRDGASSVHWACYNGDVEALEQLLHSQREDEVRDSVGRTALFYAACRGHIDCCALLMDHHDEWIDVGDRKGDTPLHVASFYQHVGVVRLLLQSAADANARNKNGYAPLHVSFCVGVCFETVVALSGGKRKRFAVGVIFLHRVGLVCWPLTHSLTHSTCTTFSPFRWRCRMISQHCLLNSMQMSWQWIKRAEHLCFVLVLKNVHKLFNTIVKTHMTICVW